MPDPFDSPVSSRVPDGQWYRRGGWWVVRERTTRPFGYIKAECHRVMMRGLNGLVSTFEWRDQLLHVQSLGCTGDVWLQDGYLCCRLRFDMWANLVYPELLKTKILCEVAAGVSDAAGATAFGGKNVFIVHGHDLAAREQLSSLVSSFGLNPIVLNEETEQGMTVIEKFEYHAPLCSFAFALMTPDDVVSGPEGNRLLRARQNVIFELGWFMAKLGRARVAVLCRGQVEILSDLQGLIYIPFKDSVFEASPRLSLALRDAGMM